MEIRISQVEGLMAIDQMNSVNYIQKKNLGKYSTSLEYWCKLY